MRGSATYTLLVRKLLWSLKAFPRDYEDVFVVVGRCGGGGGAGRVAVGGGREPGCRQERAQLHW